MKFFQFLLLFSFTLGFSNLSAQNNWESFEVPPENENQWIFDLEVGSNGDIHLVSNLGYFVFDGVNWARFYGAISGSDPFLGGTSIELGENGIIWFGSVGAGLAKYDGNSFRSYFDNNSDLLHNAVTALQISSSGNLWIGYGEFGLTRKKDAVWEDILDYGPGNDIFAINTIAEDKLNNIWLGTRRGGVFKFDGNNWEQINPNPLSNDHWIWDIEPLKNLNGVWCGTDQLGLAKYQTGDWSYLNTNNSKLPSNAVFEVYQEDNHRTWVGTNAGLAILSLDTMLIFNTSNSALLSDTITSIKSDHQGGVWIATGYKGITHITKEEIEQVDPNSIRNVQKRSFFAIYPNPVNAGKVFLQLNSASTKVAELKVFNKLGKLQNLDFNSMSGNGTYSVDVSSCLPGIYFVQLLGNKGKILGTEKLVVE